MGEPHRELRRRDLDPDPFAMFARWWADRAAAGAPQPDAIALATATPEGSPSLRMVLLKGYGPDGFRFFTHATGRKGRELEANAQAAMLVYDARNDRQVRLEGSVERLDDAAADAYWATRSRASRISAAASRQSEPVADRPTMERARIEVAARYVGDDVPRPTRWRGYRLVPRRIEFWQDREDRFHDRFLYEREADGAWRITRLWP